MPARFETIGHEPTTILDGAHNPAGALALADALARGRPDGSWRRGDERAQRQGRRRHGARPSLRTASTSSCATAARPASCRQPTWPRPSRMPSRGVDDRGRRPGQRARDRPHHRRPSQTVRRDLRHARARPRRPSGRRRHPHAAAGAAPPASAACVAAAGEHGMSSNPPGGRRRPAKKAGPAKVPKATKRAKAPKAPKVAKAPKAPRGQPSAVKLIAAVALIVALDILLFFAPSDMALERPSSSGNTAFARPLQYACARARRPRSRLPDSFPTRSPARAGADLPGSGPCLLGVS